jgi:hypothetical protein
MERAQGTFGSQKKNIEDALEELRNTGRASHELIVKVSQARKINSVCGFGAVRPWEVGELDEEWFELLDGLYEYEHEKAEDEKQIFKGDRQFEEILAKRRREHPSYRKT